MNKPNSAPKQTALAAIGALSDEASFEEIAYCLYVLEGIHAGLEDFEAGRTVPHEEVVADVKEWLAR